MTALLLVAVALLCLPLYLVAAAILRTLDRGVDVTVRVRPAEDAPGVARRERRITQAHRAKGALKTTPPAAGEDTWGVTDAPGDSRDRT